MDVTPSQEMVDEGIAREVVNKIQKLRKKVRGRRGRKNGRAGDWEELETCKDEEEMLVALVYLLLAGWTTATRPSGGGV